MQGTDKLTETGDRRNVFWFPTRFLKKNWKTFRLSPVSVGFLVLQNGYAPAENG